MRVIDLKKYKSLPQNMQAKSSSKKMQVNDQINYQKNASHLRKRFNLPKIGHFVGSILTDLYTALFLFDKKLASSQISPLSINNRQ